MNIGYELGGGYLVVVLGFRVLSVGSCKASLTATREQPRPTTERPSTPKVLFSLSLSHSLIPFLYIQYPVQD